MTHRIFVTDPNLYGKHSVKQPYFILIGIQEAEKDYILDSIPLSLQVDSSTEKEKTFAQMEIKLQYVSRCLPCGFSILGLSTLNNMEQNILNLENTLYIFKRFLEKFGNLYKWKRALLLNVDDRKPVCKLIDLQYGGKSVPCKLKDSIRIPPLYTLETVIDIDWTTPCSGSKSSILSWLSETNQSFCSSLYNGFACIDKCYFFQKNQSEDWIPQQERRHYEVEIFTDQWFPRSDKLYSVGDSAMRLRAQVPCRVYFFGKIPSDQIVSLFVQDWKQSFESSIEIALEEFGDSAFDLLHTKMIWNLPKRIFIDNDTRRVPYCDYVLPEDTRENVEDRLKSLLNFSVKECEESHLCFFEQVALSESNSLPSASIRRLHSSNSKVTPKRNFWNAIPNKLWICCILVVIFAVLWTSVLKRY